MKVVELPAKSSHGNLHVHGSSHYAAPIAALAQCPAQTSALSAVDTIPETATEPLVCAYARNVGCSGNHFTRTEDALEPYAFLQIVAAPPI
jgi:hypothetical protein